MHDFIAETKYDSDKTLSQGIGFYVIILGQRCMVDSPKQSDLLRQPWDNQIRNLQAEMYVLPVGKPP